MSAHRRAALALLSLCGLAASCEETIPGELVGAFSVVIRAEENTCGPRAAAFAEGSSYAVELREEEPRGYWRLVKTAPIEGSYRGGSFEFRPSPRTLDFGRVDQGTNGCLIIREESLIGSVATDDAGARDSDAGTGGADSLTAEHHISFRPDPNGRCALVTGPLDVLDRLPCLMRYKLTGTARSAF
jgi:hypothetical protein